MDEIKGQDIEVYAVWYNMLASDSESRWPEKLLVDPRVTHYWDAKRVVGIWYGENVTAKEPGHVEWDMYFLYPADSMWIEDGPTGLISQGRTIVDTRNQLKEDVLKTVGAED